MSTTLIEIALKAKENPKMKFTSLARFLTPAFLKETWKGMNKSAVEGIDGETIKQFEQDLDARVEEIVCRLKAKKYRAPFVLRVDIPKGKGETRPLGITTVEDRLVQRAVASILNAVFEQDYLDLSYGYRTGRKPHDALSQLRSHIMAGKVNYVYEADITSYFTKINHEWLRQMLKQRIVDTTLLRLIGKWLRVGVMQNGVVTRSETGTPQGGPISCVLANIYLHYVLDLWFEKVYKKRCQGAAYMIRYVEDFVSCFQKKEEAYRFDKELRSRIEKFNLEIAPEKTRTLSLGRFARTNLAQKGLKALTFTFLGLEHICAEDRKGKFCLKRKPCRKSCRKFLERTKEWLGKHTHMKGVIQQGHLTKQLKGFYEYFGLHHCRSTLS